MPQIRQTKYLLALAAFAVACVALFVRLATFTEWASFVGTLFTLYGAADVVNTHLQQSKKIPPEEQTA